MTIKTKWVSLDLSICIVIKQSVYISIIITHNEFSNLGISTSDEAIYKNMWVYTLV